MGNQFFVKNFKFYSTIHRTLGGLKPSQYVSQVTCPSSARPVAASLCPGVRGCALGKGFLPLMVEQDWRQWFKPTSMVQSGDGSWRRKGDKQPLLLKFSPWNPKYCLRCFLCLPRYFACSFLAVPEGPAWLPQQPSLSPGTGPGLSSSSRTSQEVRDFTVNICTPTTGILLNFLKVGK